MNFSKTTNLIKSDLNTLKEELKRYGSQENRNKSCSCVHCNSSDALHINEKNNTYHCFSCGTGGDVINLIQDKENVSFSKAVEIICNRYNINYPRSNSNSLKIANTEPNPLDMELKALEISYNTFLENSDLEKAYEIKMLMRSLKENKVTVTRNDNKIYFENTLSERKEEIRNILNTEGLNLLIAPTGTGKTYTIVSLFKELSNNNKDRVFIILCPNRVQNQQNGEEYGINVVIGGIKAEQHITVMSGVYEKIEEIINAYRNKKITLVVDEAHELLESINYRKKAIDNIDDAISKTFNTIHLTATGRKLKAYYEYENIFEFDFFEEENNNNLDTLSIIPSNDYEKTLFSLLKLNKQNNKKSLVFLTGSKENILNIKNVLEKVGYKVGTITSGDKQSQLYLDIVNYSTISNDFEVVLSTKVLECGTNIKNSNIVPIEVITNNSYFNLDSTEQKFARLRSKNQNGYLIVKEVEEAKEIKSFNQIKSELEYRLNQTIVGIEIIMKNNKDIDLVDITRVIEESLINEYGAVGGTGTSVLDVDKENFKIAINKKKLINMAFRKYDKQFLENLPMLEIELATRIKATDIETLFDISIDESDELKKELKEIKKLSKEEKEIYKEKARQLIKKLYESGYLEEYLCSNDKFELLQNFKTYISEDLYKNFEYLEEQESELKKLKILHNVTILKDNFNYLMKNYEVCESVAEANRVAKHINYLEFNQIATDTVPKIYSSYSILRFKFDAIRKKQGRITKKAAIEVVEELYNKKLLWQFDKQRVDKDYESYLIDKNKKDLDKIYKKVIHELGLIYELKKDNKGFLISSLK